MSKNIYIYQGFDDPKRGGYLGIKKGVRMGNDYDIPHGHECHVKKTKS